MEQINLKNITNPEYDCGIGACPAIYLQRSSLLNVDTSVYIIIGKKVPENEIAKLGLEAKIGPDEMVVQVPREIIDERVT